MAINTSTLFTSIGHLAYTLKRAHTYAAGNLPTDVTAAVTDLKASYPAIAGPLASALPGYQSGVTTQIGPALAKAAGDLVIATVNADVTLSSQSLQLALFELVRQMVASGDHVAACTVAATAAAAGTNVGNGAVVTTVKRGDGRQQDNLLAETGLLTCGGDAQNGSASAGAEPFQYSGDQAPAGVYGYDWPGASGATAQVNALSATGGTNLLTNGGFETFTVANTPDSWTLGAGVAGTDIFSEASLVNVGAGALKFLGTGSVRPIIRQTLTTLKPNRVYAVNAWLRSSGVLTTAANFKITLVDGSNTAITDDQGAANGVSFALNTLTTSYVAHGAVLITPKTLPAVVKVQIEASNGANLVAAEAVYLDTLAMTEVTFLYPGGPALAVFAGSVPFMTGDYFTLTTTNNQNGQTFGATFQRVFHRFFNTPSLGLLLPTSGGGTALSDTLIA